ncbi:MAG: HAD family hydrolase, partial [Oscillospiraceae bacterium]|nr:HAD family hydrolase [Oscillospiraceae bacterium]
MILENRDTVLFDLDGTLLPFRQEDFVHNYFGRLVQKAMPLGFDKDTLVKAVWAGTGAMVENDGSKSNCQAFWEVFTHLTGRGREELEPVFLEFYQKEFDQVREVLRGSADRSGLMRELRRRGC